MFVVLMDVVTERSFNWVQRDTLLKLSRTGCQNRRMTETTSPIGTGLVLKSNRYARGTTANSVGKEQD